MKLLKPYQTNPHLPLLVYCPGMDGTGQLLSRQARDLSQFFDIRCLCYDRGAEENWERLSKETVKLIEEEEKTRVYLLGESFGGCLALKAVLQRPSLFEKVILVNPASAFGLRSWLSLGSIITRWMPNFLHHSSCLGLLPFLAALGRLDPPERRALLQAMQSLPQWVVSGRIALLHQFHLEVKALKQLPQPFLLIAGQSDRLLPSVEEARRLQAMLRHAQLLILPHSGHACLLEKELQLSKILQSENFLPALSVAQSVEAGKRH